MTDVTNDQRRTAYDEAIFDMDGDAVREDYLERVIAVADAERAVLRAAAQAKRQTEASFRLREEWTAALEAILDPGEVWKHGTIVAARREIESLRAEVESLTLSGGYELGEMQYRAEQAEAKVARIEALIGRWEGLRGPHPVAAQSLRKELNGEATP